MWSRINCIACIACFAVCVSPAVARDIYVNNLTGDDRNDGGAPVMVGVYGGPHRTLTRALRAARKGDRIIVANTGQAYSESITLQGGRHSGYPDAPFEVIGNGAVLDGTEPLLPDAWTYVDGGVFRYRVPRSTGHLLYLDGKPARQRAVHSVDELGTLQPLEWCRLEQFVYFCVEPGRLPQTYAARFTALPVGITLDEVQHVVVRDLVVQGYQLDGINAHDGVRGARLVGLNCRGNGRSGISVGGASRVQIDACLVGNNGAAQVRTEGYCHAELISCDLLDNTAPRIVQDWGRVDEVQ
jgi:hypothetical protein